ncbi:MAG: ATP-binding protein [Deltaproteobacteria bacterium]|nr:MAG: ATP-binding protein [Deltaproteobacteria bacterium]
MNPMVCCKTSFKLKNNLSELDTLCRNLQQFGNSLGLTKKCIFQINLALDELFTNIISYGYPDSADHWINIAISHENGTLIIRIEDTGVPFDPDSVKTPELIDKIEDCRVGGLGIHLIKKLMDEIVYERCGNKNILTLKKNIETFYDELTT